MLGDLVRGFVPDSYSWIYGIFNEGRIAIIAEPSKTYIELSPEDIQPVPLTPEILEKNGFEEGWWWRLKGEDFWLRHSGDEYRAYTDGDADKRDNFCWIRYVHELQHCFRLLGIEKKIVI